MTSKSEPDEAPSDISRDHLYAEQIWKSKGDHRALALAIGNWLSRWDYPNEKPEWAFEACRLYFLQSMRATRPVITSSLGPGSSDENFLDEVADFLLNAPRDISLSGAIKRVAKNRGFTKNEEASIVRRITRQWNKECAAESGTLHYLGSIRMTRAAQRQTEEFKRKLQQLDHPDK